MQPLSGVKVLDFSTLLPGPMASLILAEAGAEVVKIERPGQGEDMRHYEPRWGREGVNFAMLNRGKKSLALDLKDPDQRDALMPLIGEVDVLLEQFRPGVMMRLGLGYETLRAVNSRLVYCSISGYGASGPKRDVAGHDLNYIGDTGLLALSMGSAETPVLPPALIADIAGGTYPAVLNILLALRSREQTGEGCHLDIAMTDHMFTFLYWALGSGMAAGRWPGNGDGLVTGGSPRYQLYPTADGQTVAAAPIEQRFWTVFCELIALDEPLRDDTGDPQATKQRVCEIIRSESADYWRERFRGRDCCCSIVESVEQALANPHFRARGLFDWMLINEAGARMPALPVPVAPAFRAPSEQPRQAPALGADNDELLQ